MSEQNKCKCGNQAMQWRTVCKECYYKPIKEKRTKELHKSKSLCKNCFVQILPDSKIEICGKCYKLALSYFPDYALRILQKEKKLAAEKH